jgi:anti-sigma B factor antagonist
MNIADKLIGRILVVRPEEKRLDAAAASSFKGRMVDFINQGHATVVLDLTQVEFVDSSGLTAIVSTLKSLGLSGGEMVVCGVGPNLQSLFKLTKLDRVFKVFDGEKQAVDHLQG